LRIREVAVQPAELGKMPSASRHRFPAFPETVVLRATFVIASGNPVKDIPVTRQDQAGAGKSIAVAIYMVRFGTTTVILNDGKVLSGLQVFHRGTFNVVAPIKQGVGIGT